jgi:5S rRNA maturation endonuclease (ribonuclease M5)
MNEDGIVIVCEALGLNYGRGYPGSSIWGPHISISCPLAPKNHSDVFDGNMSCSVQIVNDGPSGARCFSGNCGFKGKLQRLIKLAVEIRGSTPELIEVYKSVEAVEKLTFDAIRARAFNEMAGDPGRADSLQKFIALKKQAVVDRDVLPETAFDAFRGSVPGYAIQRGITVESAKRWGLGYDKDQKYLVFPVRRRDGKLVGLVGRSVLKDPPRRHHNYMGLDKARHLFGAQLLALGKPVVVVEGCIDAINTEQALQGEACVVASLGEGFSQQHAKTLSSVRPPCVYIFTDGDAAGHAMASKIEYALHGLFPIFIMECPWGPIVDAKADGTPVRKKVDPSDLPADVVQHLFRTAKSVTGKTHKIDWTVPTPTYEK